MQLEATRWEARGLASNHRNHLKRAAQCQPGMTDSHHCIDQLRLEGKNLQDHSEMIKKASRLHLKWAIRTVFRRTAEAAARCAFSV